MKKIITQEQINQVLKVFEGMNMGVKDYSSMIQFFNSLPVSKDEAADEDKPVEAKTKK